MKRIAILLFGVVTYCVFFVTFLYLIAFVGNLQQTVLVQWLPWLAELIPKSIDYSRNTSSVKVAIAINLGLILLFGLQHSVMARMGVKTWLKKVLPASAERSVYVLLASLVLIFLFWQWRPLPTRVWTTDSILAEILGWSVFASGFSIVLISTFLIDHFDLFGLKQVWNQFVDRELEQPAFTSPLLYQIVRHPLYLGFILGFWGGPSMTVGHLIFAVGMTIYILIGIQFEEKDLMKLLGSKYLQYREQVPMLIPGTKRITKLIMELGKR